MKLSSEDIDLIPKSFDVVGDILIFSDFPKDLIKKENLIGKYLLKKFKNIKVITRKIGFYKGKYRLAKLKIIAGEKRKETIHKESKCLLKLDVEKCYFSPRLSTERLRIAKQIKKNEEVLVMFSGVSPYSIVISKNSKAKEIYGIEINPTAHKYALENLKLNKINNIKLFKGDVRKVLVKINKKFDRIIMPLPKGASSFLDLAFSKIKKNGIIYFYDFLPEQDIPDKAIEKIKRIKKRFKVLNYVKCGQLGPRKYRVCLDIRAL